MILILCWVLAACSRKHDAATIAANQAAVSAVRQLHTVAVGDNHWCAVLADGKVACAGTSNADGQLGDNTTTPHQTLTALPNFTGAKSVSAGSAHTCALTATGNVWCWGNNLYNQIGKSPNTNSLVPYQVTKGGIVLSGQRAISAGAAHTCSLSADGTVLCWGLNYYGELGNGGSPLQSAEPVQVSGLTDAVAIASGVVHTCALRATGSIVCWGYNLNNQLGDGTVSQRNSPVPVTLAGVSSVVDLAAYNTHTCAFSAAGASWCWGNNTYGQLGSGTVTSSFNTLTSSLSGVSGMAVGQDYGCVRRTDGTVACWGWNDVGQLGSAPIGASIAPPTTVPGISGVVDLAAGFNRACVLTSDGAVKCWGAGNSTPLISSGLLAVSPSPSIAVVTCLAFFGPAES